jgi:hypothetical protein
MYTMRQMDFDASSVTSRDPSDATVTPTGRPHAASPFPVIKPVRKLSYSPLERPLVRARGPTRTRAGVALFQEPCSEAKMSPWYDDSLVEGN